MTDLPAGVKARLASTFAQIDALLGEATQCVGAGALRSPWSPRIADVTPLQRQLIAEAAEHTRIAMREIMQRYGVAAPAAARSAAQDCHTALDLMLGAIEELGPRSIAGGDATRSEGGYTALSDDAEGELRRIVAQLLEPLDSMQRALSDRDTAVVPGPGVLGELQRIVATHGLVQLRAPLAALVERVQAGDFMIAVFGRVNAGKSSLLNHLLGADVLPVGATPATAVPVMLRHGLRARGLAQFADAAPDVFTPGRLAEFAAEHFNRGNTRHVTRLCMELPAVRLEGGVTLVDMPGFLTDAAEAAESAAELPRCDLGVVLIDATGSLALEEAELAAALHRAGTKVMILLGKADRLDEAERWQVYGHAREQLLAHAGLELPIYFASSAAGDAALRDDWITRGLEPCIAQRQALTAASLRRKTGLLCEAVIEALEQRLAGLPRGAADDAAASALADGRALFAEAAEHRLALDYEADRQTIRLLDEVAYNAAVLGSDGGDAIDVTPLLAASLEARAGAAAKDVTRELRKLAAQCYSALAAAGARPEPFQIGRSPLFDARSRVPITIVRKPWFVALGRWSVHWSAHRALRRHGLQASAGALLAAYLEQLATWRSAALAQLQCDFDAESASLRGEAERIAQDLEALRRRTSLAC